MFRDSFSRAQKFFAENPGLFPSPIDVREWMWASAIIMSRSWGQKAERAGNDKMHILVPLADMVNHDAKARKVGISEGGAIVIYAGRNLAAGEEVCITYGDKCNMELMAHYGFFVPHNNKTTCEIDHILQKRMWEK
ncbi:hypothetical protein GUITHDRAFT_121141 [Guillardia theta CCMP2712]|uniref:SET domain-containing protein n=1 Tax=Guillardia theta (strain CCMP2712) TaxID=905079 RepID=L1I8V7_GUITC|nr:hypothetical protein GUITHDRAFT_121141 [Guillardia theta CCMP2712]EKX32701.1 hypothetical protein GUITHDRAFT_121141 [Guillardia theta CCMP2712]|eukprot:XP_005819681.1 hypothetical protein GUITHDRAFT_121141 [Guillardia theta CCMP2712]